MVLFYTSAQGRVGPAETHFLRAFLWLQTQFLFARVWTYTAHALNRKQTAYSSKWELSTGSLFKVKGEQHTFIISQTKVKFDSKEADEKLGCHGSVIPGINSHSWSGGVDEWRCFRGSPAPSRLQSSWKRARKSLLFLPSLHIFISKVPFVANYNHWSFEAIDWRHFKITPISFYTVCIISCSSWIFIVPSNIHLSA